MTDRQAGQANPRGRILYLSHEALFFTTHRMPVGVAMREAGFDVHVAAPPDPRGIERIERAGLTFHPIPLARGGRNPLAELKLLASISYIVGQVEPDLVHHVSMKPVIWGGIATRLLGVPAVVHAITGLGYLFIRSGPVAWAQRQAVKALFRFAIGHGNGRVIFQNGDDRDLFLRHRLARPERIVMIRGCGVDMTEFSPAPEPEGPPVVMFPARLIGDKGLNEFIAAARILKDRGSPARFVLVGRHDPQNPTDVGAEQVAAWQAEGLVEVRGYSDAMQATLNEAHIVCLPSYREGLPRTLIEAAACGRAIVTTDVPGCREVVRHGENGLLVPVRDGAALAEALAALVDDPARRRQMAARGREIAMAEFSVERFVAESMDCYRAVLPAGRLP
ncbi:glycosyltransferase family 4 protein [Marinibaculum pumilum]|uniref:Glycosyltransferase family 4 protein n=1 Tax=Marinibaculum pumilum TaxID=1766165 RepID=A0ABV7KYM6_9PROT